MTEMILSDEQKRRLRLVAKHGAEHVSRSMSRWVRDTIDVSVDEPEMVHFSELAARLNCPDETVAAILLTLTADLTGTSLFIFDEASAREIVRRAMRATAPPRDWDALACSAMQETGNIVGTAFLNGLALALGLEIHPEAPVFARDYLEAILQPLMVEIALRGEYALLFDSRLESSSGTIRGQFTLLPDSECLDRLMGGIERSRG